MRLCWAHTYAGLFDKQTGFFRAKNADGSWVVPFDPYYSEHDANKAMYTEGDAWHTSPDISGMIGQYAQGNEPSHHIAYLYNYAGEPWKTAEKIRLIMDSLYTDTPGGLCGNEDCGQMSAWYVFSALGYYPVNPASGEYVLGSPLFDESVIHLPGGKTFTVEARNNSQTNKYILSATLDGKPYSKSYITHEDIMNGGVLELVMGPKPGATWGTKKADLPTSMTEN